MQIEGIYIRATLPMATPNKTIDPGIESRSYFVSPQYEFFYEFQGNVTFLWHLA